MTRFKKKFLIYFCAIFIFSSTCAYAASREDLKKAVALNESSIAKMKTMDLDGALNDLLAALEYSNQDAKLLKNLSVIYYEIGMRAVRKGNYLEAQKNLKAALEIDGESERFRQALANAYLIEADARAKAGQNELALSLCLKASGLDPKNVQARTQAAYHAWFLQRLEVAEANLEEAKNLDPQNKNVLAMEKKLREAAPEEHHSQLASEHFILSAETDYFKNINPDFILQELEKIYSKVTYKLNIFPKNKIPVVLYPAQEFHQHWKLPARVNGYYDGKLRIPYTSKNSDFSLTEKMIQHEITHALISFICQKPIPQWVNEGLAQWVEEKSLDTKAKDALVIYQISRRLPDIGHLDQMLSHGKNPYNDTQATLTYMKSFSLVEYLIEKNSLWNLMQFIQEVGAGGDVEQLFTDYFGGSESEVEAEWILWIERKKSNLLTS